MKVPHTCAHSVNVLRRVHVRLQQSICCLQCLRTRSTSLFSSAGCIYCLQHLRTRSSLLVCGPLLCVVCSASEHDLLLFPSVECLLSTVPQNMIFLSILVHGASVRLWLLLSDRASSTSAAPLNVFLSCSGLGCQLSLSISSFSGWLHSSNRCRARIHSMLLGLFFLSLMRTLAFSIMGD